MCVPSNTAGSGAVQLISPSINRRSARARPSRRVGGEAKQATTCACCARLIDGLDELNRALILLYLDGHSSEEIAQIVGISPGNVTTRMNRLKQRLQDEFAHLEKETSRNEHHTWKTFAMNGPATPGDMDERLRLSASVLRDDWIERHRERVLKLGPFGKFSMLVWIATMVLLGLFLGTHASQPALFATGLVLDIWVIAAGIAEIRQQQAMNKLDFGLPLVELQARIESLRIARIRWFNIAFLTGQIVWWIPLVVVVFGALGANLYLAPQFRTFAAWNIAGGIAFIPLAMWISRSYGERILAVRRSCGYIADSIAGRDIAAARGVRSGEAAALRF